VQYTYRTQEGLTEKVTSQVHTARNRETKEKKTEEAEMRRSSMYNVSWYNKEQRSCRDFPDISASFYCSKSLPPALFNANLPQE